MCIYIDFVQNSCICNIKFLAPKSPAEGLLRIIYTDISLPQKSSCGGFRGRADFACPQHKARFERGDERCPPSVEATSEDGRIIFI